jgi:hypothetical protein
MISNPVIVTREQFLSELAKVVGVGNHKDKIVRRTGLSHADIGRILKGDDPTKDEFVKLHRYFPQLKRYTMLFKEDRKRIIPSASSKKSDIGSDTKSVVQTKTVAHDQKVTATVKLNVAPAEKTNPVKVQEVAHQPHVAAPLSPIQIVGASKGQHTRIEEIDPTLADLLLKGNVRNRNVSPLLVDSLARDMMAGKWILSHQGIAIDKDFRLLDGQHRLYAIVKSGVTLKVPVTYNADPEAFNVIDLNNRPRSVADIVRLDRGTKYATSVIAAVKTLQALKADSYEHRRWTKSEIDALLDEYSSECEWASAQIHRMMPSAGVIAGLAYAYPTNKDGVAEFASKVSSRLGMTSPMAALWKAYERTGRSEPDRIDLAHMTMRCIRAHLKGEVLIRTAIQKKSGDGRGIAYRHFRHLRQKLGLPE